jgi:hypothetical protein
LLCEDGRNGERLAIQYPLAWLIVQMTSTGEVLLITKASILPVSIMS